MDDCKKALLKEFAHAAREQGFHSIDVMEMIRVSNHYTTLSLWSLDCALRFVLEASTQLRIEMPEPDYKKMNLNDLQLGQVVANHETGERGVVTHKDGKGFNHPGTKATRYVIQSDVVSVTCTDNDEDMWLPIPRLEWTYSEKIVSASVRWNPPEGEENNESLGLAILNGLILDSDIPLEEGDPSFANVYDIACKVGEHLDTKLKEERLRGRADERFKPT